MDLIDIGIERGKNIGIQGTIKILQEINFSKAQIMEKIKQQFHLTENEAENYFHKENGEN